VPRVELIKQFILTKKLALKKANKPAEAYKGILEKIGDTVSHLDSLLQ